MWKKYLNPIRIRNAVVWMLIAGGVISFFGAVLENIWLVYLTYIIMIIFTIVSLIFWRCPNCKKRLPLKYDKETELSYAYVCPKCEKRFFDDGTME